MSTPVLAETVTLADPMDLIGVLRRLFVSVERLAGGHEVFLVTYLEQKESKKKVLQVPSIRYCLGSRRLVKDERPGRIAKRQKRLDMIAEDRPSLVVTGLVGGAVVKSLDQRCAQKALAVAITTLSETPWYRLLAEWEAALYEFSSYRGRRAGETVLNKDRCAFSRTIV
jgi:hypothetical protein